MGAQDVLYKTTKAIKVVLNRHAWLEYQIQTNNEKRPIHYYAEEKNAIEWLLLKLVETAGDSELSAKLEQLCPLEDFRFRQRQARERAFLKNLKGGS